MNQIGSDAHDAVLVRSAAKEPANRKLLNPWLIGMDVVRNSCAAREREVQHPALASEKRRSALIDHLEVTPEADR